MFILDISNNYTPEKAFFTPRRPSTKKLKEPGVDPTKLFFFANEEFFRFLLVSLRFCYIQKKIIGSKMT